MILVCLAAIAGAVGYGIVRELARIPDPGPLPLPRWWYDGDRAPSYRSGVPPRVWSRRPVARKPLTTADARREGGA